MPGEQSDTLRDGVSTTIRFRLIKGNEMTLLGNGHETTNTVVKKRPR